ncbi:carbon-nitrogen hydrolase family protein [Actinomycetes bacterium KLBMP 9797]
MSTTIRIAAAQSAVSCDPTANGHAVRALMRQAHDQGARLVHFPEGAISGYPGSPQAKQALAGWNVDWAEVREQVAQTATLAADLGVWAVIGANHRLTPPNRPHNSLYIISDRGTVVARYDKRYLSYTEITDWYTPGFDPVTFDVDGFRFGCALCIEVNFPELWLEQGALDVDCVLFSTFSEDPIFDILARGYAAAHGFWVSVAVPAQCSAAMPSGVLGPHGYRLASAATDLQPGIVCVDLDRDDPALDVALNKARPWRRQARAGALYQARRVDDDPRSTNHSEI